MTKTKRESYMEIIEVLREAEREDLVLVIEHEIELINRKNASRSNKPSANAIENTAIKEAIVEAMEDNHYYSISELIEMSTVPTKEPMSNQRMARIANDLVAVGILKRVQQKNRKVTYTKA